MCLTLAVSQSRNLLLLLYALRVNACKVILIQLVSQKVARAYIVVLMAMISWSNSFSIWNIDRSPSSSWAIYIHDQPRATS